MKTVTFAKRWVHHVSDTVREEYPAGSTVDVSEDRAKAAQDAGVLKGEPVDAKPAEKPETTPAAASKTKGA